MENAVDALKVVLAIIVFAIGLVLLFSMASRARETAEILISEVDRTKYYTPLDSTEVTMDNNGNRIVTIKDIIPAIYRYSEENYETFTPKLKKFGYDYLYEPYYMGSMEIAFIRDPDGNQIELIKY